VPGRSGPEALLRAPDGSSTVGGQHLPTQPVAPLPGMPGGPVTGQVPGVMPTPGLPAPAGPAPAPALGEVPIPVGGLPVLAAPAPVPAPQPAVPPQGPANGEQFGPLNVAAPGAPR